MFGAFGVDRTSFVARFNEGLTVMRRLWTEERIDHDGRFFQLDGAAMEPKPVAATGAADLVRRRRSRPPSVVPSNTPTGSSVPARSTTAAFVEQVRTVREALDDAGRDPSTFRIATARLRHGRRRHDTRRASAWGKPCAGSTATSGRPISPPWP